MQNSESAPQKKQSKHFWVSRLPTLPTSSCGKLFLGI